MTVGLLRLLCCWYCWLLLKMSMKNLLIVVIITIIPAMNWSAVPWSDPASNTASNNYSSCYSRQQSSTTQTALPHAAGAGGIEWIPPDINTDFKCVTPTRQFYRIRNEALEALKAIFKGRGDFLTFFVGGFFKKITKGIDWVREPVLSMLGISSMCV
jgi:hypothetical protein